MKRIAQFFRVSREQFGRDIKGRTAEETDLIYGALRLPARATSGSAGYDIYAPYDIELAPGESALIPTGMRARMEEGWTLMILPRSGLGFKFRLQMDNTAGIIDSDYFYSDNEGHILVKLTNGGLEGKTISIPQGTAMVQGIFLEFGITADDDAQGVRNGGFGSTTKTDN